MHKPNNNYSWLPVHTHCTNQMLCAKESYPTPRKTLYGTLPWTTFPALTGTSSGCSWCWHFPSRFPSGILVPSDSHLLSRPLSSTDTADLFHVLQIKPSSKPEGPPVFSTGTLQLQTQKLSRKAAHEWFHKLSESQRNNNLLQHSTSVAADRPR